MHRTRRSFPRSRRLTLSAALTLCVLMGASRLGCAASQPTEAVAAKVIDGDTVQLANGEMVRYIGVDTPETHRRVGDRWVNDVQPFGREATDFNRRWVEGKRVRLEYDVEPRDHYGRLLAYVYVDGEMIPPPAASAEGGSATADRPSGLAVGGGMINAKLLAEGYARLLTIPPNVKHVDEFRRLVGEAREGRRGLWADHPVRKRARP